MRKLVVIAAMLGLLATLPAKAATTTWASYAVASSQYSSNNALSLLNPLFGLLAPIECLVFSQTICPPGPPPSPGDILAGITGGANGVVYGPWSAMQATGAPNTYPSCGDIPTAWAPLQSSLFAPDPVGQINEPEALAVFYKKPITNAKRIDIYETNIGHFVTRVVALLADGRRVSVFKGNDPTPCPGVLRVPVSVGGAIVGVVITTRALGWEEIDAVGIVH